jgi:hypothetical protein
MLGARAYGSIPVARALRVVLFGGVDRSEKREAEGEVWRPRPRRVMVLGIW